MEWGKSVYVHEDARIAFEEYQDNVRINFALAIQFMRNLGEDEFFGRFPAFPAVVGSGSSKEEALRSLQEMYQAYVDAFLEENGLEGFKQGLEEGGFQLETHDAEILLAQDQSDWMDWSLREHIIPTMRVPLPA